MTPQWNTSAERATMWRLFATTLKLNTSQSQQLARLIAIAPTWRDAMHVAVAFGKLQMRTHRAAA